MSVQGSIDVNIAASENTTGSFVGNAGWAAAIRHTLTFGNGNTANNITLAYVAERTVSASSNDDIDLTGTLETALGSAFDAAEIVGIAILNKQKDGTANTTNLTVGGATNAFEGFVSADGTIGPIKPGGLLLIVNPDATGLGSVSGGSTDELRVANSSGATNKYQIAIFARTA